MEPRGDELVFTLEHCLTEGKLLFTADKLHLTI